MKRLTVNLAVAFVLAVCAYAQGRHASPASIRVHDLTINSFTLDALNTLARNYRVVIGRYGVLPDSETYHAVNISIRRGTLRDAFDAIVKADPRLEWSAASNGAIHFVYRGLPPPSLLAVTVRSFDVKNPSRATAAQTLDTIPEVAEWVRGHGCDVVEPAYTAPFPSWGKFSVHARSVSFSALLDEVAATSHTYYWSAVQHGSEQCKIYLTP